MHYLEHDHIIKRVMESMKKHGAFDTLNRFIDECQRIYFERYKALIIDSIYSGRKMLAEECEKDGFPFDLAIEQLLIAAEIPDCYTELEVKMKSKQLPL